MIKFFLCSLVIFVALTADALQLTAPKTRFLNVLNGLRGGGLAKVNVPRTTTPSRSAGEVPSAESKSQDESSQSEELKEVDETTTLTTNAQDTPAKKLVILCGPPGSGKGTLAKSIVPMLKIPHLSTGDMLRAAVSEQTDVGRRADEFMSSGKLVPDELVINVIKERLQKSDCNGGCLFDGFPRTLPQARALDEMLAQNGDEINAVVELDVPSEVLTERICGRWTHKRSGRSYHVKFNPPQSYKKMPEGTEPTTSNMWDDVTGEPLGKNYFYFFCYFLHFACGIICFFVILHFEW